MKFQISVIALLFVLSFTQDPFCLKTEGSGVCVECISFFYLKNSSCHQVNTGCLTYDNLTGQCKSCLPGVTLNAGNCVPESNTTTTTTTTVQHSNSNQSGQSSSADSTVNQSNTHIASSQTTPISLPDLNLPPIPSLNINSQPISQITTTSHSFSSNDSSNSQNILNQNSEIINSQDKKQTDKATQNVNNTNLSLNAISAPLKEQHISTHQINLININNSINSDNNNDLHKISSLSTTTELQSNNSLNSQSLLSQQSLSSTNQNNKHESSKIQITPLNISLQTLTPTQASISITNNLLNTFESINHQVTPVLLSNSTIQIPQVNTKINSHSSLSVQNSNKTQISHPFVYSTPDRSENLRSQQLQMTRQNYITPISQSQNNILPINDLQGQYQTTTHTITTTSQPQQIIYPSSQNQNYLQGNQLNQQINTGFGQIQNNQQNQVFQNNIVAGYQQTSLNNQQNQFSQQQIQSTQQQQQIRDPNCNQFSQELNRCTKCAPRYSINNQSGLCTAIAGQCSSYDEITGACLGCNPGFVFMNGQCYIQMGSIQSVSTNCKVSRNGVCQQCYKGYIIRNGACVVSNLLCATLDSNGFCLSCYPGYLLNNGNCVISSSATAPANCAIFTNGVCVKCSKGSYFSQGQCVAVSPLCQTYDENNGNCLSCFNGYTLQGNTCVVSSTAPSQTVSNCRNFTNGICYECSQRFYMSNGQCLPVNDFCNEYNPNTGVCTSCYQGFVLQQGACYRTLETNTPQIGQLPSQLQQGGQNSGYQQTTTTTTTYTTNQNNSNGSNSNNQFLVSTNTQPCIEQNSNGQCIRCNPAFRLINGQCMLIM